MTESFSALEPLGRLGTVRRSLLITGAAGRIGSYFARHARERYTLRLMVQHGEESERLGDCGEVVTADLGDLDRLKALCQGIDTVVHLAANPDPSAPWNSILQDNIVGTYHLFTAARAAGCRRVVYASSIHAVSGYPPDVQVKSNDPVNPGDLYGVSKCFGEALGRYMAEQEALSVIAIRIGAFQSPDMARAPEDLRVVDAFVSERDLAQLIQRCIDVENVRFAIVSGLSNNRVKRLDISDARTLLGYDPQDDATALNPDLAPLDLAHTLSPHNLQGEDQQSGLREEL